MNFQKISEILPKVLAQKGVAKISKEAELKSVLEDVLRGIFEAEVGRNIKVKDYKDGVVYLFVANHFWAQKVQLSSGIILEKMTEMGFANIKRIYSKTEND